VTGMAMTMLKLPTVITPHKSMPQASLNTLSIIQALRHIKGLRRLSHTSSYTLTHLQACSSILLCTLQSNTIKSGHGILRFDGLNHSASLCVLTCSSILLAPVFFYLQFELGHSPSSKSVKECVFEPNQQRYSLHEDVRTHEVSPH
jgi:hypothetical protein